MWQDSIKGSDMQKTFPHLTVVVLVEANYILNEIREVNNSVRLVVPRADPRNVAI